MTEENFTFHIKKYLGNKYDYSQVNYVNGNTLVNIICPEHGEFKLKPNNCINISTFGCPMCIKEKKTQEFIKESKKRIFRNKYDYSEVDYKAKTKEVGIICPKHGKFWQTPLKHESFYHSKHFACPICELERKHQEKEKETTEGFIKQARKIHGNKFDYSKVNYIDKHTKVCIICQEHGEFWQTPSAHLKAKFCCPQCRYSNSFLTAEEFIKRAKQKHGDKYDYSKVEYKDMKTKVCIISPIYGEFWQTPSAHLSGPGCPYEASNYRTKEEFINQARRVHGDKFDYSKVEYVNNTTKICIICPEHGEFWIYPNGHINSLTGCPKCSEKESSGEKEIAQFLKDNNIQFEREKTFSWLKHKGSLRLDFYLPEYNIAIEVNGLQHFESIDYFGGVKGLKDAKKRDNIKFKLCEKHKIKLLYYANYDYDFPYDVITNKEILLENIKTK